MELQTPPPVMNNSKEIGIAELLYNEQGDFISAVFTPTMVVNIDSDLMKNFESVDCSNDLEKAKEQAKNVFATWFQSMNDIELADRERYEIGTRYFGKIRYWGNGKVKSAKIKFIFKPIK